MTEDHTRSGIEPARLERIPRAQPVMRRLARALAIAAGLGGFVAALLVIVLMTPPGGWLTARLIETLVTNDRQILSLEGVSGPLARTITIERVQLQTPQGESFVSAEAITLALSFADLFRARLTVRELHIENVMIAGVPEAAPDRSQTSLPFEIALEEFAVRRLEVTHAAAPALLSIRGSATLLHDEMSSLEVEAKPAGRSDGAITLLMALEPQGGHIRGRLSLEDAADHVFAAMLGLPDAGRLGLDGQIAGSGDAWTLELKGRLDDRHAMALSLTRASVGEDRYAARGSGSFAPFVPRIAAPLLAGTTAISADMRHDVGSGRFEIDALAVENDTLSVLAEGSVAADAATSLRAGLELKQATILPIGSGVTIAPLSAKLTVDGTAGSAALRATMDGGGVFLQELELHQISADVSATGFDIMRMRGVLDIRADVRKTGASDLRLASLLANGVTAQTRLELDGLAWTLAQPLSIETGTAKATLTGSGATDLASLRLFLEASLRTAILDQALEERLGRFATLKAAITKTDDRITLEQVSGTAGPVQLTEGRLAVDADKLDGFATIAVTSLTGTGVHLDGALTADVTISGTPASPDAIIDMTSGRIKHEAAEQTIDDLAARLQADSMVDGFAFTIDASATVRAPVGIELPLRASGRAKFGTEGLSVSQLDASFSGNSIRGSLFSGGTDDGVSLDVPNPGAIAALFGQKLEGAISGIVRPRSASVADGFTLSLSSNRLTHAALGVSNASISATYDPHDTQRRLTGVMKAARIDVAGRRLTDLDVSLESAAANAPVALSVSAALDGMPVRALGSVESTGGITRVQLASASATVDGRRLSLTAPARISFGSSGSRLDAPGIAVSGGQLALSGQIAPEMDVNATLSAVPLDIVRMINPASALTGTVSGRVTASGQLPALTARYELAFAGLSMPQSREAGLPPLAVTASGRLAGQDLSLDARITGVDGLDLRAVGNIRLDAGPLLDVKLSGPVPVGIARERLAASGLSVTGTTTLDLAVRGRAGAPEVSGAVRLRDGRLVSLAAALDLRAVAADLDLQGDALTIGRLTGSLATGGTISAGGTVGLSSAAGFPAELTIAVKDGRYLEGRNVAARFNADLSLSGPLMRDPLVAGEINLNSVAITVPDTLPRAISNLNISRRNAPDAVRAQDARLATKSTDASGGVRLGIAVSAPSGITVRGRGIDAELGGMLRLEGRSSAPRAVGGFEIRRGSLDLLGRKLRFAEGSLTFTGSLTPFADFLASAQAQSSTVSVRAIGPVDAIEFTFASVPALPEEEVLALLVFGRSFSNLSPLQIAQLAQSVAQLTGVARGPGLLERLTRASGLDSVDVETDEATGSTAVRVGKALNERTRVGIQRDASGTKARIDLDIGRGVQLRGETSTDGKARGGLFFERDY